MKNETTKVNVQGKNLIKTIRECMLLRQPLVFSSTLKNTVTKKWGQIPNKKNNGRPMFKQNKRKGL